MSATPTTSPSISPTTATHSAPTSGPIPGGSPALRAPDAAPVPHAPHAPRVPRVLSIAGTDPTGGAGLQADLKSIGALGGYGMGVVTALVAQNTCGVRSVHVPPAAFLAEQLEAVSDDVTIDAVKLGMLHSAPLVEVVADWLARLRADDRAADVETGPAQQPGPGREPASAQQPGPGRTAPGPVVVLDPVMVATSGDRLLDRAAEEAVRRLCSQVDLVTPNLPELAVLVGEEPAATWADALRQARSLAASARTTVLLKGGHLRGEGPCPDAIVTADPGPAGVHEVLGRRVRTTSTHGTGCSLSSAMATLAASGLGWPAALERAKAWLTGALEHGDALDVGHGHGPVDHFHELRPHLPPTAAPGEPGSWTRERWDATAPVRAAVDACAFVVGLGDGTLERDRFRWYLAQDAYYLGEYSRLLARAASLAPTRDEQVFWARGAAAALEEEAALHRSHVGDGPVDPSATTLAYVGHLHASAGGYGELVAALLPCYWLYADVGVRLRGADHDEHPFHDWLGTYGDPAFTEATRQATAIVERAAADASAAARTRMAEAFDRSMAHELTFFEAPTDA